MSDNYLFLIYKLDAFIRKYYINRLLRGTLFTTTLLLAFFLVIILAENYFYFSSLVRKILFFGFLGGGLYVLSLWVIKPILQLYRLGNQISHKQAADIIGVHFTTVQDKLLNILQLKEKVLSLEDASLIEASINQKSEELKPIPFTHAIDLKDNKRYIKYVIPPIVLFLLLLFFQPSIITDSTKRLVKNNTNFERPMPFTFILNEGDLKVLQFEDYRLDIKVEGEELPNEVYIIKNGLKYTMQKINDNNFSFVFSNLQEDQSFFLEAAGFNSRNFLLEVNPKPLITSFQLQMNYPSYLNLKDDVLINSGDATVPEGTKITWIFDAQATDKISMQFSDALFIEKNKGNNEFIFNKLLKNNELYKIKLFNNTINSIDSSAFNISVVYDAFPEIQVDEYIDSTNNDIYYYIGNVTDDYGLTGLNFFYTIYDSEGKEESKKLAIPINKGRASEFTYYWNFKEIGLKPGDRLNYFFEVYDNDEVNGSKSTRSKWMTFVLSSSDELEDLSDQEMDVIKKELTKSIDEAKDLQEKFDELQAELLQKQELGWETKKELENLLNQQKDLQNKLENLEKRFDKNLDKQSDYKKVNPEIQKKQELIQELFDQVLDEETKAMIEKLEELMKDMDKEKALEQMEEMQVSDEDLENELDRMLELLKKLEFEQKMNETIDKLEELAKKQDELAEEAEQKNSDTENLAQKQEKLNAAFDELKEDLAEMQEESEEMDLSDIQEQAEDVSDKMDGASEDLKKGKKQSAAEKQKQSAQKMSKMAQAMSNMMMDMEMASMEEDMESLRQLLENLIVLSLEQERILNAFKETAINTPKYISLVQDQFKIIDDSELVEDSLYALAKRVFEMQSFITDEIQDINKNLDKAVAELEERRVNIASVNQQYVMTGYNNLALMLSEVMEQMQQQMAQQMQGSQMCENPGNKPGSKPGKIPSLKQMQQQLSDQITQMAEMQKDGQGSKSGQSQKLAEMAAKQQAIRQALEELNQQENKDGKGSLGNLQEIIDQMDQTETDLVNKQLTNDLINRQQDILTRLLEAENAEKERDQKDERESITGKQYEQTIPPSLEEYIKKQKGSVELYKNIPPKLRPFYKLISEKYVQNVYKLN